MNEKKLKHLDRYLRRELGESPAGGPTFQWLHSESDSLRHPMVVPGEFDYECGCGTNVRIHKPSCKQLTIPVIRIKFRKVCLTLRDQWLMAQWHAPSMSPKAFRLKFGSRATYPRRGFYMPVGYAGPDDEGCPDRYIALDPGVEPNRQLTEQFAISMKRELEKSLRELMDEGEELVRQREQASSDKRSDIIDDCIRLPFNKVPGKRGGATSVPDPVLQARGDAAPAWIRP